MAQLKKAEVRKTAEDGCHGAEWETRGGPDPGRTRDGRWGFVRATAVGRDAERNAVLAGDPKRIRLLCNTNLITNIPSRGSKEERIRIAGAA